MLFVKISKTSVILSARELLTVGMSVIVEGRKYLLVDVDQEREKMFPK
jgi:hypothetical protein